MENVAEDIKCYYEEFGTMADNEARSIVERVKKRGEPRKEIALAVSTDDSDGSVWRDLTNDSLDLAKGLKYVTLAIKELSLSANLAAESAKTFIAAWRDGKWVQLEAVHQGER